MAIPDLSRLSVLVVDDSAMMRDLLIAMLGALGINSVRAVRDGGEAIGALGVARYDLVITDAEMPGMDGIALVKSLRRDGAAADPYIPIIMLTGRCEREWVEAARDAGVNEFLAKPVSGDALYQRLREVIVNPRPFVRCGDFIGPDRRRRVIPDYTGELRRSSDNGLADDRHNLELSEQE